MQCAPPKVREFETGAEMIAAAQLLRNRFRQLPPMREPPVGCPDADEMIPSPILPRCQEIIKRTARYYKVSVKDLLSERRTDNIVRPRQVAAYLCYTITKRGLPFIGRLLGDRDHTTILHARNKIERLLAEGNLDVVDSVAAITGELRTRFTF